MTYEAKVIRDTPWWIVTVDAVNGAVQARSLVEAAHLARRQIAAVRGVDEGTVDIKLTVDHVGDVNGIQHVIAEIAQARAEAARRAEHASAQAVQLAKGLAHCGVTVRDIGYIMGVSHQRAHQLISTR